MDARRVRESRRGAAGVWVSPLHFLRVRVRNRERVRDLRVAIFPASKIRKEECAEKCARICGANCQSDYYFSFFLKMKLSHVFLSSLTYNEIFLSPKHVQAGANVAL